MFRVAELTSMMYVLAFVGPVLNAAITGGTIPVNTLAMGHGCGLDVSQLAVRRKTCRCIIQTFVICIWRGPCPFDIIGLKIKNFN